MPSPLARTRHARAIPHDVVVRADRPFRLVDTTGYRALRHALRPWLKRVARGELGYRFCPLHPADPHHPPSWNVWMEWSE